MKTILDLILLSEEYLRKKGIAKPRREAEEVIGEALEQKRIDLYLHFDKPINHDEQEKCRLFLQRRGQREPLQYIVGHVLFGGVKIEVSPQVLIPRQETEILVEKIAASLKTEDLTGKTLFDMCTGSGCIAIALKKRFPALEVIASDISEKALEVARKNALLNNVEITFLSGDLFQPYLKKKAHFFVSNPPYVTEEEYATLSKEVLKEPKLALVGGLSFYHSMAPLIFQHLEPNGKGWLEIGASQKESVLSIFQKQDWKVCSIENDWASHPRFLILAK